MRLPRPPRDVVRWLGIGLLIRESFSAWTGHPFDSEIWIRNAYYVAHGWSPYGLLPPVPGLSFAYATAPITSVAYLPLWSLMLAALYQLYAIVPGGNRFVLYFLIKQPPILGDVLLGALIYVAARTWGADRVRAQHLLAFWMLFPYPILIAAIWGQFDSLVASLMIAAMLVASVERRSAYLGLGILLKSFPIIFVPYEFLRARGLRRVIVLLSLAIPVGFTAAALVLMGWSFAGFSAMLSWEAHVAPQGLTPATVLTYPAFVGFFFGSSSWIYLAGYLWIPGILLGGWWVARRFSDDVPEELVQAFLFLTVLLFLLRWQVNEQYLIYLLPLLLLDTVLWHPERRGLFDMTWIIGGTFLVVNNFFLVRFAIPAFPNALAFEFGLEANAAFASARQIFLIALGLLFSVHLVQIAAVVARPSRTPTPWLLLAVRRAWTASFGRLRSVAPGRGG